MEEEFQILDKFLRKKGLRHTSQREKILDIFLSTEKHVSCEELYKLVRKKDPRIGYTTVYRTLKILSESGLCGEIDFGDGILRFEHKYNHAHHDHLICVRCGKLMEVIDPEIEKLQDNLTKKHKFIPLRHKLQIFGICKRCRRTIKVK